MNDNDVLAEIDAILDPVKAANPGITNGEIVDHLPEHLRVPFWGRAVEQYLDEEAASIDAERDHRGGVDARA